MRVISFFAVLALLGIDQLIKYFVDLYLKNRPAVTVIRNVLQLNYLENDGAMMGFMGGKTALMTTLAVICVAVMLVVIFSGLIKDRVDFIFPADYTKDKALDKTMKNILRKIAIENDLYDENVRQLKNIER